MEAARTYGALFVEAVILAVAVPALAGLGLRRGLAGLTVIVILGLGVGLLAAKGMVPFSRLAAAQGLLFAFGLFLLGLRAALSSRRSRGRWVAASLLGLAFLASPFLADPFLEDSHDRARPAVRETVLFVNPMAGAASRGLLGVDWLRQPLVYKTITLGQYHAYQYPDPRVQALVFFLAGGLLLLLGRGQIE